MRLQDPALTRVILVTLPETTPVSQAAALQEDLRRARIEPFAWVVNRSLAGSGTRDPLLLARVASEQRQFARIAGGLASRIFRAARLTATCSQPKPRGRRRGSCSVRARSGAGLSTAGKDPFGSR